MPKLKEIKFKTISFDRIGVDGLVRYVYTYEKEFGELIETIDGEITNKWSGPDVRRKIKEIIGK